jgi:hypothetical protein
VQCTYNFWSYLLCNYLKVLESHSSPKCCHKNFICRNLIHSRHISVFRSNNAVLCTLEVGKTQSLAIFAVIPKTHKFTDCESCYRLWGNVGNMWNRVHDRERLIAAARTSGRTVTWRGVSWHGVLFENLIASAGWLRVHIYSQSLCGFLHQIWLFRALWWRELNMESVVSVCTSRPTYLSTVCWSWHVLVCSTFMYFPKELIWAHTRSLYVISLTSFISRFASDIPHLL